MIYIKLVLYSFYVFLVMAVQNIAHAQYQPANKIMEKKLAVIPQWGLRIPQCYVLRPRDSFTYVISERAIAGLDACSNSSTTWSFDVNGRISTVVNGLDYCLTAPGSVISGVVTYDYVRAFRCNMGNKAQQWYISDERHITSFVGNYNIKSYNKNLYISRKDDHYDYVLSDEMAAWEKNFSIPRSYNFSLSMNWKIQNKQYFANYRADSYAAFRSSKNNSYRVLYSPYTKLLSFQHMLDVNESIAFCLKSNSKKNDKVWQYAEISSSTTCPKTGSELLPKDMQWDMVVVDLPEDNKKQAVVKFYDQWGNALKIWDSSGSWGLAFTIPNDALPSYESVATESTGSFYVNRAVAEWVLFDAKNQQKRAQYCPSPSIYPQQRSDKLEENNIQLLPPGFTLTEDWYNRLWQIAASPATGQTPGIGVCGSCLLETYEILRSLYEANAQLGPSGNNHYFDPTSQVSIIDQFASNEPNIYLAQENVMQESVVEMNALRDLYRNGYITINTYLEDYYARQIELIRSSVNVMLPDFYQAAQTSFPFRNYTQIFRDNINHYFSHAAVGTTAIISTQLELINSRELIGHSAPLIRFNDGWVVLEVAVPGASISRVDIYNRARFATPAEAIFNYFQHRSPYVINGQNNINFSSILNTIVFTQVNLRPSVIVRNPLVSFGNCTGEGEDGRRGTGTQTEARDFVQNRCLFSSGDSGRCYGESSSSENISTSNIMECQHLERINNKWAWNAGWQRINYNRRDTKKSCEAVNKCNINGGACYEWRAKELGRCEHLAYIDKHWKWVFYPSYNTSSSCLAANKCSEGGVCFKWSE